MDKIWLSEEFNSSHLIFKGKNLTRMNVYVVGSSGVCINTVFHSSELMNKHAGC